MINLIITGSRTGIDYKTVDAILTQRLNKASIAEIIHGAANGVDSYAEKWAKKHGYKIISMPADCKRYGRLAGLRRNIEMADYANREGHGGLLAIWDGVSRGTKHMIETAKKKGLMVLVISVDVRKI